MLDVAAEVPAGGRPSATSTRACSCPRPSDLRVALELGPAAHWVADYYPVEEVEELPGERLLVALRAADDGWLRSWRCGSAGAAAGPRPAGAGRAGDDGRREALRRTPP